MRVMPAVRRRLVEPLWARASGSPLLDEAAALEASQWQPTPLLEERQWRRLDALLRFAYDSNAYYRRRMDSAGLPPDSIRTRADFARLPVLTKADVRGAGFSMVSRGFDATRLMIAKTGGSTGKPLELRFTERVSVQRNASGRRHKRWSGWEVGEPMGAVWGNPVRPDGVRARLRDWLLGPVIFLDTMSVTPESAREFAREWKRTRPTLVFGHAHSVYLLAQLVRDLNLDDIRPRAVITSSMMLLPHERATIEAVLGVRVCDMYGCEEVGLIASECGQHDGMHVNADQLVVEILREDGSPAAPGESGSVVVTDLLNLAMPFIRYRMEDVAVVSGRSCPCGRGLPLLQQVTGRVADFLRRRDGSRVAGISLIENSLTRFAGLEQMQIVQEELARIRLRVVPAPNGDGEWRHALHAYFGATFPGVVVEIEEVNDIGPEGNGKYRFSICRIPD